MAPFHVRRRFADHDGGEHASTTVGRNDTGEAPQAERTKREGKGETGGRRKPAHDFTLGATLELTFCHFGRWYCFLDVAAVAIEVSW